MPSCSACALSTIQSVKSRRAGQYPIRADLYPLHAAHRRFRYRCLEQHVHTRAGVQPALAALSRILGGGTDPIRRFNNSAWLTALSHRAERHCRQPLCAGRYSGRSHAAASAERHALPTHRGHGISPPADMGSPVPPFADGNGRGTRLITHLQLETLGQGSGHFLSGAGVPAFSPSRPVHPH